MDTPHKAPVAPTRFSAGVMPATAGPTGGRSSVLETIAALPGESLPSRASSAPLELARGRSLGRYVILSELGRGGMGVVYTAHDSELDRTVAIKVLLEGRAEEQGRMQREAQALARLAHPNVVAVHDVGIVDGCVFVAMEFVAGETLREFAEKHKDDWRRVVHVYIAAGRGLVAAHKAGLVHRDFKPDNVLVDGDDRPRVLDFGLACAAEEHVSERAAPTEDLPLEMSRSSLDVRMTQTGASMGTPAYMAPEQAGGLGLTDARADQFAFCVSLYEALYGARPFAGDNLAAILYEVVDGRIQTGTRGATIPAAVRRALIAGLAADPERRYASMAPLLQRLEAALGRRGRVTRWALTGAGVAVAAVTGALLTESNAVPCEPDAALEERLWSADRQARVREALLSGGEVYAEGTWTRVERSVGLYVDALLAEGVANCEATHVQGEQSLQMLDLRTACLDRRRRHLDALLEGLAEGSGRARRRAAIATAELPSLAACRDRASLADATPPPQDPGTAAEVERLRASLDRASAVKALGRHKEAHDLARKAVRDAGATGYPPILAEALLLAAHAASVENEEGEALRHLERAFTTALSIGDTKLQSRAATQLIATLADQGDGVDELQVRWWWANAVALAELRGSRERSAFVEEQAMRALKELGRYREAKEVGERALKAREALSEGNTPALARAYLNLSTVDFALGDLDGALRLSREALWRYTELLGDTHPNTVQARSNVGTLMMALGEFEAALPELREVVRLKELLHGKDHERTFDAYTNLSLLELETGDVEKSKERLARVYDFFVRTKGAGNVTTIQAEANLAMAEALLDPAAAEPRLRSALDGLRALDPDHPRLQVCEKNLADALIQMGRAEEALKYNSAAIRHLEREGGLESSRAPHILVLQARIKAELGALDEADALLDKADRIIPTMGGSTEGIEAESALYRALVLDKRGVDAARRGELLTKAAAFYSTRDKRFRERAALVRTLTKRLRVGGNMTGETPKKP